MTTWRPPPLAPTRDVQITERQAHVLTGMCCGYSNRQIGRHLGLTETTVKTHAKRLFVALGARDRAHAVALSVSGQVAITVRHTQQLRSAS